VHPLLLPSLMDIKSSLPMWTHTSHPPGSFHVFILRLGHHWSLSFRGFQLTGLSSCWLLWLSSLQIAIVGWPSVGSCKLS
jgi:hypothetical protein